MAIRSQHTTSLVKSFESKALKKRNIVVRIADELTSIFGSIQFFVLNITFFTGWLLVNTGKFPQIPIFDPFPFVLLITMVSVEAIVLSIIVLMSQTRQGVINSIREELDLQINLIAEREITKTLQILVKIAEKQGIKLDDPELVEMTKKTDTSYIQRSLEKELTSPKPTIAEQVIQPIVKTAQEIGETVSVNKK